MRSLQQRAKAFLDRPIPETMPYVPDSISERVIREYATTGSTETFRADAEMMELLGICVVEADATADRKAGEERAFFEESAAILRAILADAEHDR